MRLKEYTIKSAIYTCWSEIKTKMLKNTWHKLISNEEPEFDLEGLEEELLHGAFGADPSDVHDCLNKDEKGFRYQNLTEEEISQAEQDSSSEEDEKKHVHSSNFHKRNRTWTPSKVLWTLTCNTTNVT
jgi:hypothetical protein